VAKLIYLTIASLDGYVADRDGNFDWAEPDEEVHTFVNDLQRPVGTFLLGRHVRRGGRLGDPAARPPAALHPRLRAELARGRQGRVFEDAGGGIQLQDPDRAELRPRLRRPDESVVRTGPSHRRSHVALLGLLGRVLRHFLR
jgi:hypothetical protein